VVDQGKRVLTGEQLSKVSHKKLVGVALRGQPSVHKFNAGLATEGHPYNEKKRAQTLLSPLWKVRSGRLPGTALSITSSR